MKNTKITRKSFFLDINECYGENDNCHKQATCSNKEGSFSCTCNHGYSGNGVNGSGTDFSKVQKYVGGEIRKKNRNVLCSIWTNTDPCRYASDRLNLNHLSFQTTRMRLIVCLCKLQL